MKKAFSLILSLILVFSLMLTAFASSYTVASGDSLWTIANKFGISVDDLMSANSLSGEGIQIGQVLNIPDGTPSSDSSTPSTPSDVTDTSGASDYVDAISFNVNDTDIRDVLNIIARYSGKRIIYFGAPQNVTVSCSLVSCMKAVSQLVEAADGLGYMSSDNVILVGPESRMTAVFMYTDITKTIKLKNMTAADFTDVLTKLGVTTTKLAADEDDSTKLNITAKPEDMARAITTWNLIDRTQNFPTDELTGKPLLNLKEITLSSINSGIMAQFMNLMSLRCSVIPDYNENGKIYVAGTSGAVNDLTKLLAVLDTPDNANADTRWSVLAYAVQNAERNAFVQNLVDNVDGGAYVFVTEEGNKRVVYFLGNQIQIENTQAACAVFDV